MKKIRQETTRELDDWVDDKKINMDELENINEEIEKARSDKINEIARIEAESKAAIAALEINKAEHKRDIEFAKEKIRKLKIVLATLEDE